LTITHHCSRLQYDKVALAATHVGDDNNSHWQQGHVLEHMHW